MKTSVLYNPDTRSTHNMLGRIRIFRMTQGHKSKKRDPYQPEMPPVRINREIVPSHFQVTLNTDGSAIHNRWENTTTGIGVWYTDRSRQNIVLKLPTQVNEHTSNSRAELGAILEALRQNEIDDLIIELDLLSSLKAICKDSTRYKDLNWNGIQNADLLKCILIKLRTRPAQMEFKWVKGHNGENYRNERADALADTRREQELTMRTSNKERADGHPALQDRARLQALDTKHTYSKLIKWHTEKKKKPPILHQEVLDEEKDKVQDVTRLCPTNEKLLKGICVLKIPPWIRDHMRNMLTRRIKCGTFWNKIPEHTGKAQCSFCKKAQNIEILETEQHMWLECTQSGQAQVWEMTKKTWNKTSDREWPHITLGLIRGSAALTFKKGLTRTLKGYEF